MPIRFRCVYCNQLLGISRRKAGTIVRCTTCAGQLIVPDPSDPVTTEPAGTRDHIMPSGPPPTESGGAGHIFEHSDFDAILEPLAGGQQPSAVASPPAPPASQSKDKWASATASPSSTTSPVTTAPVLTLSRQAVTIISSILVLGFGLAFAGGILLGMSLK
jgi:hypothetical protein